MIETLDLASAACSEINDLARRLYEYGDRENAKKLRSRCGQISFEMRGRFGNVAEQLSRISSAARLFERQNVDLRKALAELERAVERMRIALSIHEKGVK